MTKGSGMQVRKLSLSAFLLAGVAVSATAQVADADKRAEATVAQMTDEELTILPLGFLALERPIPEGAMPGAGYIPGIARLNVPPTTESDASMGVGWARGLRKDKTTAFPAETAMASTWNPDLIERAGAVIGTEAHAIGFNVMLAGGVNLMRDPRNGRTFEYFSEDPLLSGMMGAAAVNGIQSKHVISTLKHFALNNLETGRRFHSANISDANARESDLLAFQIALDHSTPGSIMCAYNRVNGDYACGNDWLQNKVLKQDWGYKGWIMSDWGAVHALDYAMKGLDQESGTYQANEDNFFAKPLRQKVATDPAWRARVQDMNRRILRSMYAVGLDKYPVTKRPIDFAAHANVAQQVAEQGIVLLRNRGNVLPIAAGAKSIAVIGGYSDTGVLTGGGSSEVLGEGPQAKVPMGGTGPWADGHAQNFQKGAPLESIYKRAKGATVLFNDGRYLANAVATAKKSDVAIVFVTQWMNEEHDVPDISLPSFQAELIRAVAKANPNTIVVLETGGPVEMPWLEDTAAVLSAWYPGDRGAEAIAAVLFGEVNPSGRLPISFPASLDQLPRPALPQPDPVTDPASKQQTMNIDYNIEGSDVGYRWYARQGTRPLFAFGHGLSYTSFDQGKLAISTKGGLSAKVTIANTGQRTGADVAQVYLVSGPEGDKRRLAGFARVELTPGEKRAVAITLEPKVIAERIGDKWVIAPGTYRFALGRSSMDLATPVEIRLGGRKWKDSGRY